MHTHLSVNPRALNADQDAQVNGEPGGICRDNTARFMPISCLSSHCLGYKLHSRTSSREMLEHGGKANSWLSPGAEQSQHSLFPGMPLTSLMMARVSSSLLLSPPPCTLLKATFSASSLLLLRTDTQLRGQKVT